MLNILSFIYLYSYIYLPKKAATRLWRFLINQSSSIFTWQLYRLMINRGKALIFKFRTLVPQFSPGKGIASHSVRLQHHHKVSPWHVVSSKKVFEFHQSNQITETQRNILTIRIFKKFKSENVRVFLEIHIYYFIVWNLSPFYIISHIFMENIDEF